MAMQTKPSIFLSRRQFIFTGMLSVAAAWAGALAQSILFPRASAAQAAPVELAPTELPVGAAKQITYAGAPALVTRSQDGVLALSLVCTHLGCHVQWDAAKRQFYCPCHDGKFDEFGDVVAGPPPLPLERLPVKVLPNKIIVGDAA
ncbi:MAG: Rieske 2Fe-2S domain-containing protein [Chloroflexi bacterium]|nr:Rieske 2Fe-2S domain-containing protein [Chloroflexota bacterium]